MLIAKMERRLGRADLELSRLKNQHSKSWLMFDLKRWLQMLKANTQLAKLPSIPRNNYIDTYGQTEISKLSLKYQHLKECVRANKIISIHKNISITEKTWICRRECWNVISPTYFPKSYQTSECILAHLVDLRTFQYHLILQKTMCFVFIWTRQNTKNVLITYKCKYLYTCNKNLQYVFFNETYLNLMESF